MTWEQKMVTQQQALLTDQQYQQLLTTLTAALLPLDELRVRALEQADIQKARQDHHYMRQTRRTLEVTSRVEHAIELIECVKSRMDRLT